MGVSRLMAPEQPRPTDGPRASDASMADSSEPARTAGEQASIVASDDQEASQATRPNDHDAAVRAAASEELGDDVAASMPRVPQTPVRGPVDPGAAAVVRSIAAALDAGGQRGESTVISLDAIRNFSRAGSDEFHAMRERLAEALSHAGEAHGLEFASDAGEADYRMLGAAYMVNAGGFDRWELFVSLSEAQRDWQVWDAGRAIHMLRFPRPGQPQIVLIDR